jgi:hypothetical protein
MPRLTHNSVTRSLTFPVRALLCTDLVFLAREMLRDPFWVLNAANELKVDVHWPVQYVHLSPS